MPISSDCKFGKNVVIYNENLVNLYGCEIGSNTTIGPFVEIQKNVVVGSNCKISSHSFICEGVVIHDNVFIGHGVVFVNDKYPKSTNADGSMKGEGDWNLQGIIIEDGASIGSNTTILPSVIIGKDALVGAGSVVTHNVSNSNIVVGENRIIGKTNN
tara:strand:- start:31 stop:501 length:471 start_codon:yes stop_codon:yes gene_type:complete